jgi:hypothetical protein
MRHCGLADFGRLDLKTKKHQISSSGAHKSWRHKKRNTKSFGRKSETRRQIFFGFGLVVVAAISTSTGASFLVVGIHTGSSEFQLPHSCRGVIDICVVATSTIIKLMAADLLFVDPASQPSSVVLGFGA